MDPTIKDRHTVKLTKLFVLLGILFGISVALLTVQNTSSVTQNEVLVTETGNDVLIVLRADKKVAKQLQAALESMKLGHSHYRFFPAPGDHRTIVPQQEFPNQSVTIDI